MKHAGPMMGSARGDPILVVATSARALVCSAHRGGYRVQAVDGFGDQDTRRSAERVIPVSTTACGLDAPKVRSAVQQVNTHNPVAGLVYGSGLESCADMLDQLGSELQILGNSGTTLRESREPHCLASHCAAIGISYAECRDSPPRDPESWLIKSCFSSGGTAVQRASESRGAPRAGEFYQRFQQGSLVSGLFLADGYRARVLGIHEQWCADPDRVGAEFVHAGAVTRADLYPSLGKDFDRLANGLTALAGLQGLNGVDCIAIGDELVLLELNPRPCASLDLYDAEYAEGLFHWHLASLDGVLAPAIPKPRHARGYLVVYAPRQCRIPEHNTWPEWVSDQPPALTTIPAGAPLCTVHALAKNTAGVRELLELRERRVLQEIVSNPQPLDRPAQGRPVYLQAITTLRENNGVIR